MNAEVPPAPRFAAVLAAIGWFALVLQLALIVQSAAASGGSPLGSVWRFFGYFTILTNLLVAVALSVPIVRPGSPSARFFTRPSVISGICTNIVLVGVVYNVMLRQLWDPQGLQLVADELLHDVVPIAFAVYWWKVVPAGSIGFRNLPGWSIYPLVYLVYMLLRGAIWGWYPYPFLDASALGYAAVALNTVALVATILSFGAVLIRVKREPTPY